MLHVGLVGLVETRLRNSGPVPGAELQLRMSPCKADVRKIARGERERREGKRDEREIERRERET
jgi:hypothetical protein